MRPAERLKPLWTKLRAVRAPGWLGPFGREPWVVLGPLVVTQWLALLAFALTVRHNAWLYYQGGDQTYYYTGAWMLSNWTLPTAEVGWGWTYLLTPIAAVGGSNMLAGLPAIVLLNTIVLLPAALLAVYGIGARLGGRLFGYWTAVLWVALPYLAIPLWVQRYHEKYVELTMPQFLGLSALADFPSMVLLLVGAYLVLRALDTRDPREAILAGLVVGFAFAVKPSNAIFFFAPALAFLIARRWRQIVAFGAALAPSLVLVALWKQRGLGTVPLFAQGGEHVLAASGFPLPSGVTGSIGRYLSVDWEQLRQNRDSLREFFWAVRPLEWVPIAGVIALARRSWPKAGLVAAWFLAFLIVKGASDRARVEDASFWRLMMPGFPAFLLLLAAVLLLIPKLAAAIAQRFPPGTAHPRRLDRPIAAAALLLVVVPVILIATPPAQVGASAIKNDPQHTSVPVGSELQLAVRSEGRARRLTWSAPYNGGIGVFYTVLRSRPAFPDPSNPEERTVTEGVSCRERRSGSAQDCHLFMTRIAGTKRLSYVDRPPPGRWTYRVALSANWADDPSAGDLLLLSGPVTVTVPHG